MNVVVNWVEFWRWHSKVIEKKGQERNQAVKRRFHVRFEVTVRLFYKSDAGIRLVKAENPSECVKVDCKSCRSAIAL
jgi:hypothetical protein